MTDKCFFINVFVQKTLQCICSVEAILSSGFATAAAGTAHAVAAAAL